LPNDNVGVFSVVESVGGIHDLILKKIHITAAGNSTVGGLAALSAGSLVNDSVAGVIVAHGGAMPSSYFVGGLVGNNGAGITGCQANISITVDAMAIAGGIVGRNSGYLDLCQSTGTASGGDGAMIGGLVGQNAGQSSGVQHSFANATVPAGASSLVGGLVGVNQGSVGNSYALGSVTAQSESDVGGLIGEELGGLDSSYSTGAPAGGTQSYVGGLIGYDGSNVGWIYYGYWDTSTSGMSRGVGNYSSDAGVSGLTTAELQAGLPYGFNPTVWAENADINNGFPYLTGNGPVR
jgi:hypothetical protein